MLNHATIDKLHTMKLNGMADALHHQTKSGDHASLAFDDRLGMLVDAEWDAREQRKLVRRLQTARLRYPASLEDLDYATARGLDRQVVLALAGGHWIEQHQGLLITGPTGIGKSYLACAFVERACRSGYTARYVRLPRLLQELAISRGDGTYGKTLVRLAKLDLLAIDDWLLAPLKDPERRDLLEVIEDRYDRTSTLIATQLPVASWHQAIGEASLADAICDRLVHGAHTIALKGPSMRQVRTTTPKKEKKGTT